MIRTKVAAAAAVLLLVAPVAAGCGVQAQSEPQALPANLLPVPLPVPASESASASPTAGASESTAVVEPESAHLRLWFVVEDGLAAAESTLPVGSSPEAVLEALAAGPDAQQAGTGLRTIASDPLTGQPLVALSPPTTAAEAESPEPQPAPTSTTSTQPTFGPDPADVVVRVSSAFPALPPAEQVLLLGQVVLSLSGAGQRSVSFTDEAGATLAVPLPDGRLLDVPATARDYSPLIVQP